MNDQYPYEIVKRYERWCLGKHIDGKEIVKVRLIGPPSFVYGSVIVETEDGKEYFLPKPWNAFKPRKKDLHRLIDEYKGDKDDMP